MDEKNKNKETTDPAAWFMLIIFLISAWGYMILYKLSTLCK